MLNRVLIQGRLTKEPDLKQTQSGISKLLFTVAWSEKYKEVESKCFLLCIAWRQTAEFINMYFHKGQEIVLEGHMVTEQWGNDNTSTTYMMVDKAHFSGPKVAEKQKPAPNSDDFMKIEEGDQEELPFV